MMSEFPKSFLHLPLLLKKRRLDCRYNYMEIKYKLESDVYQCMVTDGRMLGCYALKNDNQFPKDRTVYLDIDDIKNNNFDNVIDAVPDFPADWEEKVNLKYYYERESGLYSLNSFYLNNILKYAKKVLGTKEETAISFFKVDIINYFAYNEIPEFWGALAKMAYLEFNPYDRYSSLFNKKQNENNNQSRFFGLLEEEKLNEKFF